MALAGALHGPACISRCSQPTTSSPSRPLGLRHALHASARGAWSRADVRCSVARTVVAVADLADLGILDEDEEDTSRCGTTNLGASHADSLRVFKAAVSRTALQAEYRRAKVGPGL